MNKVKQSIRRIGAKERLEINLLSINESVDFYNTQNKTLKDKNLIDLNNGQITGLKADLPRINNELKILKSRI